MRVIFKTKQELLNDPDPNIYMTTYEHFGDAFLHRGSDNHLPYCFHSGDGMGKVIDINSKEFVELQDEDEVQCIPALWMISKIIQEN